MIYFVPWGLKKRPFKSNHYWLFLSISKSFGLLFNTTQHNTTHDLPSPELQWGLWWSDRLRRWRRSLHRTGSSWAALRPSEPYRQHSKSRIRAEEQVRKNTHQTKATSQCPTSRFWSNLTAAGSLIEGYWTIIMEHLKNKSERGARMKRQEERRLTRLSHTLLLWSLPHTWKINKCRDKYLIQTRN